jgi:hypothetical protein
MPRSRCRQKIQLCTRQASRSERCAASLRTGRILHRLAARRAEGAGRRVRQSNACVERCYLRHASPVVGAAVRRNRRLRIAWSIFRKSLPADLIRGWPPVFGGKCDQISNRDLLPITRDRKQV